MTLCAAVKLEERGVLLVADTIVTSSSPATGPFQVTRKGAIVAVRPDIVGRTSKDEQYQPLSRENRVSFFSEIACKLTHLGPDAFVAFSGDEVLCRRLAEVMHSYEGEVAFSDIAAYIKDSLKRTEERYGSRRDATVEGLLCCKGVRGSLVLLRILARYRIGVHEVSISAPPQGSVALVGSGEASFPPDRVKPSPLYREKPIAEALCLFCSEISFRMRLQNRYEAAGIGGAYFGAAIDAETGSSFYMPSAVEAQIGRDGRLRYLTKTLFEDGVFYSHDYLTGLTTPCPVMTIEESMESRELIARVPPVFDKHFRDFNAMSVIVREERLAGGEGLFSFFHPNGCGESVRWGRSKEGEIRFIVEMAEDRCLAVLRPKGLRRPRLGDVE